MRPRAPRTARSAWRNPKRAGQPVDLVHHHEIDPTGLNIGQQGLERRPLQRGPGEAAVIIMIWDEPPALLRLALDIGLAGLALGIERVEPQGRGYARSTCGYRWRSDKAC